MAEQQQRLVPGGFRTLRLLCLPALFWALLWALWPVHADAADVADSPDKGSPARTLLPEDSPLSPLVNDAHLSGGFHLKLIHSSAGLGNVDLIAILARHN